MTLAVSIAQSGANNVTMRNRIINGAMMIDQRNAGASRNMSSTSNGYSIDRWTYGYVTSGVGTVQQVADAPAGFTYSMKYTTTTATTSNDYTYFDQPIEASNCSDFAWGTSNGISTTLSFWVKVNNAGTYSASVRYLGGSATYIYNVSYAVSSANTWTYVTLTIPAPPTAAGAFSAGFNTEYLQVEFLVTSSGFTGTATSGAWTTSTNRKISGTYDLASTLNATWQITGVQLEAGTTATPFEQRLYGTELALCQRYYFALGGATGSLYTTFCTMQAYSITAANSGIVFFPVTMRTSPSFSYGGSLSNYLVQNSTGSGAAPSAITVNTNEMQPTVANIRVTTTGIVAGNSTALYANNNNQAQLQFSAEL